jgi:hypothetical protein
MKDINKVSIFSCIRYESKTPEGWQNTSTKGSPVEEQATEWLNSNELIPLNTDLNVNWVTNPDGQSRISVINLVVAAIAQKTYIELLSTSFSSLIKTATKSEEKELPGILVAEVKT